MKIIIPSPNRMMASIKRGFSLVLGALAMIVVMLLAAFITMRLAIHGREVDVPNLAGLTFTEAGKLAGKSGLNVTLENKFYSTVVPAGHILSQSPAPGSRVRRAWDVRVTQSLGLQQVEIPNVIGQPERTASIQIRRLGLDVGTVARIASASDPDIVLAQTPPANAGGVDRPRVSLLLSTPEEAANPPAFAMPSLTGQSLAAAAARLSAAGLHIASIEDPAAATAAQADPSGSPTPTPPPTSSVRDTTASGGTVVAQSPQPGRRVTRADPIRLTIAR